ncbi:MAG TPA: hypothetical protein VF713_03530 [Thermoanaerobaculia bacterium]
MTGVSQPAYPTDADMITFALNFGTTKIDAPAVISFETTGYEHVAGLEMFTKVVANRNLVLGSGTLADPGLAGDYAALNLMLNQITAIETVYTAYAFYGDSTLSTRQKQVVADMQTIVSLIQLMDDAPAAKYSPPALPSLSYGTPALTYTTGEPGYPIGLGGGTPFGDVSPATIAAGSSIAALTLYGKSSITGMEITYTNGGGVLVHGNNTDPASATLNYAPSEVTLVIDVNCDASGALYTLTVSKGTIAEDGTQQQNGSVGWPNFPFPKGGTDIEGIYPPLPIGFTGSVNNNALTELGIVTITLSPATWSTPPSQSKSVTSNARPAARAAAPPPA